MIKFNILIPLIFPIFFVIPIRALGSIEDNFSISNKLIHGHLNGLQEAQLHFFWTTGRSISDNMHYQPNLNVDVGGSKYGSKFFDYVDLLLQNSPSKLKVKFICDQMTLKANKDKIGQLLDKYDARFEVIDIYTVENNLLQVFPGQASKIKVIFKNATQGNPDYRTKKSLNLKMA